MGIRRTRFCDGKKDGAFSLELGQINDAAGADATRRRATHVSQQRRVSHSRATGRSRCVTTGRWRMPNSPQQGRPTQIRCCAELWFLTLDVRDHAVCHACSNSNTVEILMVHIPNQMFECWIESTCALRSTAPQLLSRSNWNRAKVWNLRRDATPSRLIIRLKLQKKIMLILTHFKIIEIFKNIFKKIKVLGD